METLHIENLSFHRPKAENNAVESINLIINSGEFIVFCSESGCGKTTLLTYKQVISNCKAERGESK